MRDALNSVRVTFRIVRCVTTKYRVILSLGGPQNKIWGKEFQNLEKRIQVCLDVKGDQFQHRL